MIDAKTKVFGLLANPIGHSLSPRFQNALAAYCGENAAYLPFEVKRPECLEAALIGAHALGKGSGSRRGRCRAKRSRARGAQGGGRARDSEPKQGEGGGARRVSSRYGA